MLTDRRTPPVRVVAGCSSLNVRSTHLSVSLNHQTHCISSFLAFFCDAAHSCLVHHVLQSRLHPPRPALLLSAWFPMVASHSQYHTVDLSHFLWGRTVPASAAPRIESRRARKAGTRQRAEVKTRASELPLVTASGRTMPGVLLRTANGRLQGNVPSIKTSDGPTCLCDRQGLSCDLCLNAILDQSCHTLQFGRAFLPGLLFILLRNMQQVVGHYGLSSQSRSDIFLLQT